MPRARGQIDTRKSEAILAAAAALLTERGLSVPLEEVARRAKVSKQTVYNHFGSKTDLVRKLVERRRQMLVAPLKASLPTPIRKDLGGLCRSDDPRRAHRALWRDHAAVGGGLVGGSRTRRPDFRDRRHRCASSPGRLAGGSRSPGHAQGGEPVAGGRTVRRHGRRRLADAGAGAGALANDLAEVPARAERTALLFCRAFAVEAAPRADAIA